MLRHMFPSFPWGTLVSSCLPHSACLQSAWGTPAPSSPVGQRVHSQADRTHLPSTCVPNKKLNRILLQLGESWYCTCRTSRETAAQAKALEHSLGNQSSGLVSFYISDIFPPLPPARCNLQRSQNYWYFPGIQSLNPSFVLKSAGARVKFLQIVDFCVNC